MASSSDTANVVSAAPPRLERRSAPVESPAVDFGSMKMRGPPRLDRTSMTLIEQEMERAMERKMQQEEEKAVEAGVEVSKCCGSSSGWRCRLVRFLHSTPVHTAATALLILDLILVIVSLELQIQALSLEGRATEHCLEQYEHAHAIPEHLEHNPVCNPEGLHHCDPHSSSEVRTAEKIEIAEFALAIASVAILSTFLLENLLLLAALGLSFFRQFFFVLDILVVSVSLGLELWAIIARGKMDLLLGGIVIVARMWRFFRVAHGIYFLEHAGDESSSHPSGQPSNAGEKAEKESQRPPAASEAMVVTILEE